jgi:hypothetical protein
MSNSPELRILKLFETLLGSTPPNKPAVNHLFHIAASPPDELLHPQHNDIPAFDQISWQELPEELRKV